MDSDAIMLALLEAYLDEDYKRAAFLADTLAGWLELGGSPMTEGTRRIARKVLGYDDSLGHIPNTLRRFALQWGRM